jgi:hypothetical protein
MLRILFAAISCLGLVSQLSFGSPVQLIQGLSGAYTPGQPVAFDVLLPAISNLGSYNIDLVLDSSTGTAGVDFFFDVAATVPATTHYVFPTAANYFDSATVDSPLRHRITLTDFDLSGVNVVPGTNDHIANVVYRTLPTFHGSLSVSVNAPLLILDTPDITPTPIAGFSGLRTDIASAGAVQVSPVPEPTSIGIIGFAVVAAILNNRRFRVGRIDVSDLCG